MQHFRSHVMLTVWPIVALFGVGLWHIWPALQGGSSYAAASPAGWLSLIAFTLFALVFFIAYSRGWSERAFAEGHAGPYRSSGCVRLQKLAGGLAWALIAGHLVLHWVMTFRVGPVALSHYELLRGFLSRPFALGLYVLGLAALGLYLSQGIAASFRSWGLGTRRESSRWLEVSCTLVSALMIMLAVNVLSHFATGRAYWFASAPSTPVEGEPASSTDGGEP